MEMAVEEPEQPDQAQPNQANQANQPDQPAVLGTSIYLERVEDLSAADIERFVLYYFERSFQMHWINDNSLNIVYDTEEEAFQAMTAITAQQEIDANEQILPLQLRTTKTLPDSARSLVARFSTTADRKQKGSRAQSDYYKAHGTPHWREDRARFGAGRAEPMKYGTMVTDLFPKGRKSKDKGDLFPEKNRRKRGGKRKERKDDLFGHLVQESKIVKPKKGSKVSVSVYREMDY